MIKNIYQRFKENFGLTFKFSTFLLFMVLIVYGLILLVIGIFPITDLFGTLIFLFITSILVGLTAPTLYSYFVSNDIIDNISGIEVDFQFFLANRKVGKDRRIKSQLNIFKHLLIAFAIFVVLFFVVFGIQILISYSTKDNGLYAYFLELEELASKAFISDAELEKALLELTTKYQTTIVNTNFYCGLFSTLPAIYYFIHSILMKFMKFYVISSLKSFFVVLDRIYKETAKESGYNLNYYKVMFPYTIVLIISYLASYILLFYIAKIGSITILVTSSIVISLFILLPFLPVLLNFNKYFASKFVPMYLEKFNFSINNDLEFKTIRDNDQIDKALKETSKEIEEILKNKEHYNESMVEKEKNIEKYNDDNDKED